MSRLTLRGIRLRLALALLVVVTGALAVVYLIVVPSLEEELVSSKLEQLEVDAMTIAREYDPSIDTQAYAEAAASVFQERVVIYLSVQDGPLIHGDSNTDSSLDVKRDPFAKLAAETGKLQSGT